MIIYTLYIYTYKYMQLCIYIYNRILYIYNYTIIYIYIIIHIIIYISHKISTFTCQTYPCQTPHVMHISFLPGHLRRLKVQSFHKVNDCLLTEGFRRFRRRSWRKSWTWRSLVTTWAGWEDGIAWGSLGETPRETIATNWGKQWKAHGETVGATLW